MERFYPYDGLSHLNINRMWYSMVDLYGGYVVPRIRKDIDVLFFLPLADGILYDGELRHVHKECK
jgi:hypothetical protein